MLIISWCILCLSLIILVWKPGRYFLLFLFAGIIFFAPFTYLGFVFDILNFICIDEIFRLRSLWRLLNIFTQFIFHKLFSVSFHFLAGVFYLFLWINLICLILFLIVTFSVLTLIYFHIISWRGSRLVFRLWPLLLVVIIHFLLLLRLLYWWCWVVTLLLSPCSLLCSFSNLLVFKKLTTSSVIKILFSFFFLNELTFFLFF